MTDNASSSHHLADEDLGTLIYSVGVNRDLELFAYSHIALCAECMTRLGDLRESDRQVDRLLDALDVPLPVKSADSVIRAAVAGVGSGPGLRRAAAVVAFLVVAAAVAAAAIPSSALHRLLITLIGSSGGASITSRSGRTPPATQALSPGVSFTELPGASLEVAFGGTGVGGSVDVRVVGGEQVSLSSPTTGATYRVGTNRIAVDQTSPAQFKLDIPRSLHVLRVRVGGNVVYERAGSVMTNTFTIQLRPGDAGQR